ncbi:hypothetical protein SCHPADRAFT_911542 [Schizopora paradoxa]|uniref:Uncharacterized protein n=1 Tax=Schizopora paradoxa TaxID=27342 RepID=A0A0H2R565_9AGAM|nr:hypothetical protein SCHPADRAFT_911542 [Schizopora paradoxa]
MKEILEAEDEYHSAPQGSENSKVEESKRELEQRNIGSEIRNAFSALESAIRARPTPFPVAALEKREPEQVGKETKRSLLGNLGGLMQEFSSLASEIAAHRTQLPDPAPTFFGPGIAEPDKREYYPAPRDLFETLDDEMKEVLEAEDEYHSAPQGSENSKVVVGREASVFPGEKREPEPQPECQHGSLDDVTKGHYKNSKRESNPYSAPQGPTQFDVEKMLTMLGDMAQYVGDMMNSDSDSDRSSKNMTMVMGMGMGDNSDEDVNKDVGGDCKRSSAKFGRRWCSSTIH